MIVRELKVDEIPLCLAGGQAFFDEAKAPGTFNPEHFADAWKSYIISGFGVILAMFQDKTDTLVGAIGGVVHPNMMTGDQMAMETFWYVLPDYRGSGLVLVDQFERWAMQRGADYVSMIHLSNLHPESMAKFYRGRGYQEIERVFIKKINQEVAA